MLIGILQTGYLPDELRAEHGDYPDLYARLLERRGLSFRTWPVVDMDFPDSVHAAQGWLITGSRHGAYDELPFIAPLENFIREAVAAAVPVVGICFGHQIIAQALGGKVEKFAGGWAVGHSEYTIGGRKYALNAWHQDQVTEPPESAAVVGESEFCRYAALAYGDRAFSVQPHPEFGAGFLAGLMHIRGPGVVPAPLLAGAEARLDDPTDEAAMADMIADFFLQPRSAANG